jgi:phosphopantothenoylcysteine decarboxylase/phosphopantothenate--cysteine ligase
MLFENKNVILGITGSISAYKSALLTRQLIREGADVQVVMSQAATEFISPLTFKTLTGNKVYTQMFEDHNSGTRHIDLGKWGDVILVAPATANLLARVNNGIADDLLTALILAFKERKVAFAPAMNVNMYKNPITQNNIQQLIDQGYYFIEPGSGELACGDQGYGRLAETDIIIEELYRYLNGRNLLAGKNVVVTAGPTREYLDQVRFISNRSTGKMGYALANEAAKEGGSVTLISGPTDIQPPPGVNTVNINSALEMQESLLEYAGATDYLFMAAAVEDIAPRETGRKKLKKADLGQNLRIKINPDIVKNFREKDKKACIVGFSVEMEEGLERSKSKMKEKGLDFIVWNNPLKAGAGFAADTNEVVLVSKDGEKYNFPKALKRQIAEQIITTVVHHYE